MNYSWRVKMHRYGRNGTQWDTTEYGSVIARNINEACRKALKNAIKDSGFKSIWVVVEAVRGDWVVS